MSQPVIGSPDPHSPSPELDETEEGGRCLITTLPTELLSTIHELIFKGLNLVDEQLQRYRFQRVCRGFNQFFARPEKTLMVADVDRAVALRKRIKSGGRKTPTAIRIHLDGDASSRSSKFGALIEACDLDILCDVTLEFGRTPLGVARTIQSDWIGVPLRRALCTVKMENFRLRVPTRLVDPTLSVDALEEYLAAWPRLRIFEAGRVILTGSRTTAINIPRPPFRLPKRVQKVIVRIGSTDACILVRGMLECSKSVLSTLHLKGTYTSGSQKQFLHDLLPSIRQALGIRDFACRGGDELITLARSMSDLQTFELWSSAIDAGASTTMAILRSMPDLKHVLFTLNSRTIDFTPADLVAYFSGPKHVERFEIYVNRHFRKTSPLALWDKKSLDEVKEVAEAEGIAFIIDL